MADQEPNYKVIELQAENDKLKDEIIEMLKTKVSDLTKELELLKGNNWKPAKLIELEEQDQGSHMIAQRPVIRTMSEAARILETNSMNKKKETQSAQSNSN